MTTSAEATDSRRDNVANRLAVVRHQVAEAAKSAGRSPSEVTLVAVTKSWPSSDVRLLAELGVADVGENKAQELVAKVGDCEDVSLTWHFVGQLQRNKVKQVVPHVSMIHSVDRVRLVSAIDAAVAEAGQVPMQCLIQVNLDPSPVPGRAGVMPTDALRLADEVAAAKHLELKGVMGVAPHGDDPTFAFEALRNVSAEVSDQHGSATVISAGMSGDFVPAIAAGATHIRLGSALLGERARLVR